VCLPGSMRKVSVYNPRIAISMVNTLTHFALGVGEVTLLLEGHLGWPFTPSRSNPQTCFPSAPPFRH
jgi:hypothetical protein